jgi:hypothetical protein
MRADLSEHARRLIDKVGPADTLSPTAYARIRAELENRAARAAATSRRRVWSVALAAATIGVVGGATAATLGVLPLRLAAPRAEESVHPREAVARTRPVEIEPAVEEAPLPAAAAPADERHEPSPPRTRSRSIARRVQSALSPSIQAKVEESTRRSASDPTPSPRPVETPRPSAIAEESELLSHAVQALEREHDPRRAIFALDEYARRYPQGLLRQEATLARVDALNAAGDPAGTLRLLDALDVRALPRARELFVLRGELRGHADRCREAIEDFTHAMAADTRDALDERARFGRASCRFSTNDRSGGIHDLEEYLERHPAGRFAETARARLVADRLQR